MGGEKKDNKKMVNNLEINKYTTFEKKKWCKEEFLIRSNKRKHEEYEITEINPRDLKRRKQISNDPLHQGIINERASLKAREFKLNLQGLLGKTQTICNSTEVLQLAGFYCKVCECILKDSVTYLDHINGKWHQRALGMSMRVEKVGLYKVRKRIAAQSKKDAKSNKIENNFEPLDNYFRQNITLKDQQESHNQ